MQTTQSITEQAGIMNGAFGQTLGRVAEDMDHLREQYAYSVRNNGPWAIATLELAEAIDLAQTYYNAVRGEVGLVDKPVLDVL